MKKNKIIKIVGAILLFLLLAVVYFQYPITIMPDSTEYYGYLKIFYGQEPFSSWNIVRGPTFPFLLYMFTVLFGNTQLGLLIGSFILYCIMLIIGFKFLKLIDYRNNFEKAMCYIIYFLGIMFNPMIIGYMHGLLTEFVAIPMFVITVFLCTKWIKEELILWKKIIISIVLAINCVFMWFLKQPYVFIAFAPILVSGIISIFEKPKIKNIIYRLGIISASAISVVIGIQIWNAILINTHVDNSSGRDTNSFIKGAIINGNTAFSIDFYEDHYKMDYINTSDLISNEDKEEIIKILNKDSEYKSFKLINLFNNFSSREEDNISKKIVLFSKEEDFTTSEALRMYFKLITKYPGKTIKSYIANYLAIADVVPSVRHKDANVYYPSTTSGYYYENQSIGYSIFYCEDNMLWLNENHHLYENVKNLKVNNNSNKKIDKVIYSDFGAVNFAFKVTFVLLPFLIIYLIIMLKVTKKRKIKNTNLKISLIIIASSFIHTLFHAMTGAIIDRYAIPVWPACIIAILMILFGRYDVKIDDNTSGKNKGE